MPQPALPFLDLIDKRQDGLISPSFFTFNARGNLIRKVLLTQELRVFPSPTRGCSMKVCDDCFLLAPAGTSKLLIFKYDSQQMGYILRGKIPFPAKHHPIQYGPLEKAVFTFKFIDFEPHVFTATSCDKVLQYGDPESLKIVERITHSSDIGQHRISKLNPFNVIAAGDKGHMYISDMRTGSVVMSISTALGLGYSEHCAAWSPSSDRIVCSLANSCVDNHFPLGIYDLRKPASGIGPVFKFDTSNYYRRFDDSIPFVDFLDTGFSNLMITFINDCHFRIWDIFGNLIQTIPQKNNSSKFIHMQPAILSSELDSFIFIPDKTGIKIHSSTELLYLLNVSDADLSVLGYSKSHDHIIGLSSYSFKTVYVWECGKSKE